MKKNSQPRYRPPTLWDDFFKDRRLQFRVLVVAGAVLFFVIPAMIAGGLVLYDLFVSQGASIPTENGQLLVGDFINAFVPRLATIGIIFGMGTFILLVATRGFPELESVFTWIGFALVASSIFIGSIITYKCRDGCETSIYVAGLVCVTFMTILGYIIPVMTGKPIGWYALFFVPLLLFQVLTLLPYLFMTDQTGRTTEEVVKNIVLVFTTAALITGIGLTGGWRRPKSHD